MEQKADSSKYPKGNKVFTFKTLRDINNTFR
jgi:hypothetical protein